MAGENAPLVDVLRRVQPELAVGASSLAYAQRRSLHCETMLDHTCAREYIHLGRLDQTVNQHDQSCEQSHNRAVLQDEARNRRRHIVALMWNRAVEWDAEDWRKLAACRHTEPDLFFPIGTTGPAVEQIESAKQVCLSCEAITPCLEFALATNQESGVWGGTSEEERRKLRKAWLAARRRAS